MNRLQFLAMPTVDELEHGNRVAGIFGATGDNGTGIAGVMWSSNLTLYALGANGLETSNVYDEFVHHLVQIVDNGTRILSISASFGTATDTANIRWIVQALQIYFRRGGTLIYAIGNDAQARPTLAQLRATTDPRYSGLDKALAILRDVGFADNIITVGAADTTGAFLDSTSYWMGGTDILAPGLQILTLGLSNTTSVAPYGTSYATPYVAGVAAQLLAMDPTLTAAQVKDYILRGARQPRLNEETGQIAPPPAADGAPETVYQLDAYGALTLLASERPGISLCGNRVWVSNNALIAERNAVTHTTEQLVSLGQAASFVNVSHGGRRIQIDGDSLGARQVIYNEAMRTWRITDTITPGLAGGTFRSSTQWSHDRDTALVLGVSFTQGGSATVEVQIWDTATHTMHLVNTIPVPLTNTTDSTCIWQTPGHFNYFWVGDLETGHLDSTFVDDPQCHQWRFTGITRGVYVSGAFSPRGGQVLAAVTRRILEPIDVSGFSTCPWDESGRSDAQQCRSITFESRPEGATVWRVDLPNGQPQTLWNRPGEVFWLGIAEGGGEVVVGEGTVLNRTIMHPTTTGGFIDEDQPPILTDCSVAYYVQNTGVATAPVIPNNHVCQSGGGEGTIAPSPRRGLLP